MLNLKSLEIGSQLLPICDQGQASIKTNQSIAERLNTKRISKMIVGSLARIIGDDTVIEKGKVVIVVHVDSWWPENAWGRNVFLTVIDTSTGTAEELRPTDLEEI